jgi:hypothetical protein
MSGRDVLYVIIGLIVGATLALVARSIFYTTDVVTPAEPAHQSGESTIKG